MKEAHQLLLTKDTLEVSNCCRFCSCGAYEELEDNNFISIYDKLFVEDVDNQNFDDSECLITLDTAINKYLPLKVSNQELYYPKVICNSCSQTLENTIKFFQRIAKGQKILQKIINRVSSPQSKSETNHESRKEKENGEYNTIQFSKDHPILQSPRRRGRPRKDETEMINQPNKTTILPQSEYSNIDSKPKRQTKRPIRYIEDVILLDTLNPYSMNEFNLPNDDVQVVQEQSIPNDNIDHQHESTTNFLNSEPVSYYPFSTDDNPISMINDDIEVVPTINFGSITNPIIPPFVSEEERVNESLLEACQFNATLSRHDDLMDFTKLSVIMDGDEEEEGDINTTILEENRTNTMICNDEGAESTLIAENQINSTDIHSGTRRMRKQTYSINSNNDNFELSSNVTSNVTNDNNESNTKNKMKHMKKHQGKKKQVKSSSTTFDCELCFKKFHYQSSLSHHRASAHATVKKYTCPVLDCNKQFSHKPLLINHSSVHSNDKEFKCKVPECSAAFKNRASLYTHTKSVHWEEKHTCDQCNLQFTLKSSLKSHLALHIGDEARKFECNMCHKKFFQKNNMIEHMRVHTKEKPFKCQYISVEGNQCERAFSTASQLTKHKVVHLKSKQFICEICGRGYKSAENFKNHMQKTHTTETLKKKTTKRTSFCEKYQVKEKQQLQNNEDTPQCLDVVENESYVQVLSDKGSTQPIGVSGTTTNEAKIVDGEQVLLLNQEDLSYYAITFPDPNNLELESQENLLAEADRVNNSSQYFQVESSEMEGSSIDDGIVYDS